MRYNKVAFGRGKEAFSVFNIGASELIVILLIAFLVVGPKDLPKVGRALGRFVRQAKAMVEEVKREAGVDEVEADLKRMEKEAKETIQSVDIRPDIQQAQLDVNKEIGTLKKELSFQDFKAKQGGKKL